MTRDDLARLLQRLAPELDALAEPWTVIGSAAILLAGVDWPDCADLDIATTGVGAARLEAAWAAWREVDYAPDPDAPFRSRFSRYDFGPGAVEVMGGLEVRTPAGWTRFEAGSTRRHPFDGRTWPAPDLAGQIAILKMFGRPKDLAKAAALAACLDG